MINCAFSFDAACMWFACGLQSARDFPQKKGAFEDLVFKHCLHSALRAYVLTVVLNEYIKGVSIFCAGKYNFACLLCQFCLSKLKWHSSRGK